MTELNVGYARVSTDAQDLTAQRDALAVLGVEPERIYVDHGLTGTSRERPGSTPGVGRVSWRRHAGGGQARSAGSVATRRPGDR